MKFRTSVRAGWCARVVVAVQELLVVHVCTPFAVWARRRGLRRLAVCGFLIGLRGMVLAGPVRDGLPAQRLSRWGVLASVEVPGAGRWELAGPAGASGGALPGFRQRQVVPGLFVLAGRRG